MEKELSCAVVRDLLPLYAEGLVSEETKGEVEAHLEICAACRQQLDEIRDAPPTALQTDASPLKQIKRRIRWGEWLAAALSGMLVLLAAVVVILNIWTVEYSYTDIEDKITYMIDREEQSVSVIVKDMPKLRVIRYNWPEDQNSPTHEQWPLAPAITLKTSMWNHLQSKPQVTKIYDLLTQEMMEGESDKRREFFASEDGFLIITEGGSPIEPIRYINPDGTIRDICIYIRGHLSPK